MGIEHIVASSKRGLLNALEYKLIVEGKELISVVPDGDNYIILVE